MKNNDPIKPAKSVSDFDDAKYFLQNWRAAKIKTLDKSETINDKDVWTAANNR
jgi:hypothetical protein